MNYQVMLGDILFSIETPLALRERVEINRFAYRGEIYRERINVFMYLAKVRPQWIEKELYRSREIRIGLDRKGNEVREYRASFLLGNPEYAVSVAEGSNIHVFLPPDQEIWEDPNVIIWNLLHLDKTLLRSEAFVLHCSYLMYKGEAILFSAPSGTGKTTQAKLWEKLCPEARIINGDKALLMRRDGVWFACGYPFHGSARECFNESYPIRAVVVLRQSQEDVIEEMQASEKAQALLSEATVPKWDVDKAEQAMRLIDDLMSSTAVIRQRCTMKDEAAYALHRKLYGVE